MHVRSFNFLPRFLGPREATDSKPVVAADSPEVMDLRVIYEQHREALWSFSLRLVGDPVSAEDLVHDVFVSLPRVLPKIRAGTPLRSFLMGVVANLGRNHLRAARRRRRLAENWGREAPFVSTECPERSVSRRNLAAQLQRALDELSHNHRVVFVLSEIEQHSTDEVAEILNLAPGTVRSRLFHAKRQLQALLWQDGQEAR
jgi:RNA polymerase sigma-70 factor, ECF subfamily